MQIIIRFVVAGAKYLALSTPISARMAIRFGADDVSTNQIGLYVTLLAEI